MYSLGPAIVWTVGLAVVEFVWQTGGPAVIQTLQALFRALASREHATDVEVTHTTGRYLIREEPNNAVSYLNQNHGVVKGKK